LSPVFKRKQNPSPDSKTSWSPKIDFARLLNAIKSDSQTKIDEEDEADAEVDLILSLQSPARNLNDTLEALKSPKKK